MRGLIIEQSHIHMYAGIHARTYACSCIGPTHCFFLDIVFCIVKIYYIEYKEIVLNVFKNENLRLILIFYIKTDKVEINEII